MDYADYNSSEPFLDFWFHNNTSLTFERFPKIIIIKNKFHIRVLVLEFDKYQNFFIRFILNVRIFIRFLYIK